MRAGWLLVAAACGHSGVKPAIDASAADAGAAADAPPDATAACAPFGAPGTCITTEACAALGDHTSYVGYCPGPADIQCCIVTPDVADNPPVPAGWQLMQQADVTTDMTTWAVMILNDPTTYPMFSTATMVFGSLDVLARVEWHPPDFQNSAVHRGVTLYEPAP
ncbi:MAG TPA: hypothetical protein VGF94_22590 [Kofleriaceae bacterium]|jgi:hypothetical protein